MTKDRSRKDNIGNPSRNEKDRFRNGDILTRFFRQRLGMPIWAITLVLVLFLNIPIVIAAANNDILLSNPGQIGLLNNYGWFVVQFSSVPATIFYFFWLPDGVMDVITGLVDNKILKHPKKKTILKEPPRKFLDEFESSYSKPIWEIGALFVIFIFMVVFSIPEHQTFKTWETTGPFIFWFTIFFWAFIFYLGLLAIIKVSIVIYWFNKLFKSFQIDVRVLHPDGAGGLSALGDFSVKIGYLIGIYGIASVSTSLSQSIIMTTRFTGPMVTSALILLLLTYVILAPIVFFAPIGAARSAMKVAKNDFLLAIADQFEEDTEKLETLLSGKSDELKMGLEKIEQLQKIHQMASKFPVWPFNVQNLVRFFSAISSPFVLTIVTKIVEYVIGLI